MKRRLFLRSATAAGLAPAVTVAAEVPVAAASSPAPVDALREKVVGIGGVFFRSSDPTSLARWYEEHLGIPPVPTTYGAPSWNTEAGVTVFSPFPAKTTYFETTHAFMLNFRVRDLDKMATQLKSAGIAISVDPQQYPNGHFARLHDPEGNPIELWQPK